MSINSRINRIGNGVHHLYANSSCKCVLLAFHKCVCGIRAAAYGYVSYWKNNYSIDLDYTEYGILNVYTIEYHKCEYIYVTMVDFDCWNSLNTKELFAYILSNTINCHIAIYMQYE